MPNIVSSTSLKNIAALFSVAIFFLFDRILKILALKIFPDHQGLLGDFFIFSFTPNRNIAFSLPLSGDWLNWLIALVIVWLVYIAWPKKAPAAHNFSGPALWFLIAGALSNLADRWLYGHVIDYFEIKGLTVFNLADAMIVLGAGALIWRARQKQ